MRILRADPVHPIRKRLWQAAIALGLVVGILVGREAFFRHLNPSHTLSLGEDFLPVYAAGILVREGRSAELYAMEPLAAIERKVVADADLDPLPAYGPFLNPPYFAAAYVPFTILPYRPALSVWVKLNIFFLIASAILLCRMLPRSQGWRTWGLVPLLLVLPLFFWEAVWYQQNTFLSLFLTCSIVSLWRVDTNDRNGRFSDIACGIICGLLFYKPQLALVMALALICTRGARALIGLGITGSALLLLTLCFMPGTLSSFLHTLPPTIHWMRTALAYNWGQQATAQSFWRLLIQGNHMGETHWLPRMLAVATGAAFAIALLAAARRFCSRRNDAFALDRMIAATICSMPLLMPYYMEYDLMLLAVPPVLLAAEWVAAPRSINRADRYLLGAWTVLLLESHVNCGLGSHLRLNLAVPLIGLIAGISICRCWRQSIATSAIEQYDTPPLAAAA